MAKTQGLAAFGSSRKSAPAAPAEPGEAGEAATAEKPTGSRRRRGQGSTVALSVRLEKDDWKRLRQLADDEGVSLQELAEQGFSLVLKKKGLPAIGR